MHESFQTLLPPCFFETLLLETCCFLCDGSVFLACVKCPSTIHSFVLLSSGTRHQSFSWTSSHRRSQWTQARTTKRTKPPYLWKLRVKWTTNYMTTRLGIFSVFRFLVQVLARSSDASKNAKFSLSWLFTLTYMLFVGWTSSVSAWAQECSVCFQNTAKHVWWC